MLVTEKDMTTAQKPQRDSELIAKFTCPVCEHSCKSTTFKQGRHALIMHLRRYDTELNHKTWKEKHYRKHFPTQSRGMNEQEVRQMIKVEVEKVVQLYITKVDVVI